MRLWHKDLISVLPDKQLIGQWRECCLIAKNIAENGTPNHLLVNKVMQYSPIHFYIYCSMVYEEMVKRGYKCDWHSVSKHFLYFPEPSEKFDVELFPDWHNDRYLMQCFYNLQEKYDCGGMSVVEYARIVNKIVERIDL